MEEGMLPSEGIKIVLMGLLSYFSNNSDFFKKCSFINVWLPISPSDLSQMCPHHCDVIFHEVTKLGMGISLQAVLCHLDFQPPKLQPNNTHFFFWQYWVSTQGFTLARQAIT
jgi:hypothetical protein